MTVAQTSLQNLQPFKPGESGKFRRSKRFVEIRDQISAELGNVVSAIDQVMVDQIVNLMCAAERPGVLVNDRVRATNSAARLLRGLRDKYAAANKSKPRPMADIEREIAEHV